MRCRYQERAIYHGDYIDVDIYPAYRRQKSRSKKYKPTTEVMQRLNSKNREKHLTYLCNENFTSCDIRLDLTYSPENHPEDEEQAKKDIRNFIRRVKTRRKKYGLPELKYIYVTEIGEKGNKFHHHAIISGDMSIAEYAEIWGKGYTTVKPLQFNEDGLAALAQYLLKNPIEGNAYHCSRNLKQPEEKHYQGRLSKRAIEYMAAYDDTSAIERLYPEYHLTTMTPFYNEVNGGYYFHCHFYRPPKYPKNRTQRKPDLRSRSFSQAKK